MVAGFIAYIVMAALLPSVHFLRRKGVPTTLSVAIPLIVTILLLVILIFPLVPFFISQVQSLIVGFPSYLDQAGQSIGFAVDTKNVQSFMSSQFAAIGRNAFFVTGRVFGGVVSVLTIFVVIFYLLLDGDRIKRSVVAIFPKDSREKLLSMFSHIEEKLGAWARGQIVLSGFIGILTWVALVVVGIDVALPLAVIAAILEVVPTIGPLLAAFPAVVVALTISPGTALAVAVVYFIIQILENNILVPRIMQKAVGLNPIVVILCILAGGELMGVVGALLAIPFLSMLIVVFRSLKSES